jgi:hypothetical protein
MSANDKSRAKAEATTTAAWEIIDAEKAKHDAKTARLRAAREAREAQGQAAESSAPKKGRQRRSPAAPRKRRTDAERDAPNPDE